MRATLGVGDAFMSGSNGFDPSREWLGIAAVDLADPFRALGLSPTSADAAAVDAAAERLLRRLRNVDPGPFRLAHESLCRRIDVCRDEALAALAKRPRAEAHAAFAPRPDPQLPTFGHHAAPPPVPPPPPVPLGGQGPVEPEVEIRLRRPARRRQASGAAAPAILSLVAAAAAVAAAYALWPEAGTGGLKPPRPIAAVFPRPTPPTPPAVGPAPAPPQPPTPVATVPAPPAVADEPPSRPMPPAEPAKPEPPMVPSPHPVPTPDPVPPQDPPPTPEPPRPTPEQRARLAAEVDRALSEALAALRRSEFDTADRQIAKADRLAEDDERLADRVTCWRQLAVYARQFPEYRNRALLAAGGDYDVGRTKISVIESTPEIFKYKSSGSIKRIPPAEVPPPIVNAIVRAWFAADDQPGNHLFLGCEFFLRDPPAVDGARREWEIAKRGGQNVQLLEPLLDDPLVREAARQ